MSFLPKKLIRFHIIYNYQPNSKEYEMESGIIVRNLYDDTVILLGRFKDSIDENDIQFESRYISRNHARIWLMNKEVYIKDTASHIGTFLNGKRLSEKYTESVPYKLNSGHTIRLGDDNTTNGGALIKVEIETLDSATLSKT